MGAYGGFSICVIAVCVRVSAGISTLVRVLTDWQVWMGCGVITTGGGGASGTVRQAERLKAETADNMKSGRMSILRYVQMCELNYRPVLDKIVTKLALKHVFLAMFNFERTYAAKFKDKVNALCLSVVLKAVRQV